MKRPRWLVAAFLGLQIAIPSFMLLLRWIGVSEVSRWGWHMFSVAP